MRNLDIRIIVAESKITYRRIAEKMGISRGWLSHLMRYELTSEDRDRILKAIRELTAETEKLPAVSGGYVDGKEK